ncbi:MAG: tetratricopeptide repeat protein [Candidatus Dormibacteria bacterium]
MRLPTAMVTLTLGAALLGPACGVQKTEAQLSNDSLTAGLAAQQAGKASEATADYQTALQHDPNNKWAMYDLGVIYQGQNRPGTAEVEYRKALAVDPDFELALYNLAIIRAAIDTGEAAQLYRHIILIDPGNANAHLNLGVLLESVGDQADGSAEIARALQLNPALAAHPSPAAQPAQPGSTPSPSH